MIEYLGRGEDFVPEKLGKIRKGVFFYSGAAVPAFSSSYFCKPRRLVLQARWKAHVKKNRLEERREGFLGEERGRERKVEKMKEKGSHTLYIYP